MICPNCGKEYNEKMTCCISCGAELVPREKSSEQIRFEPVIPETAYESTVEDVPETGGFARVLKGHSEYPPMEKSAKNKSNAEKKPPVPSLKPAADWKTAAARGIGSFAASLAMFTLLLLTAASLSVRLVTDSDKISQFTAKLDVMSLPAAQTVMLTAYDYEISPDATIQEAIFVMSSGTGLTREDIREIYESSTVQNFLCAQLSGYAEFIREGKLPEKLTSEKLKEVFSENISLISEAIGKPLTQHDIELAFAELDRAEPVLEAIAPSRLENGLGEATLTLLRLVSSLPVIIGEGAAAAAMLAALWAINRKAGKTLGWGGAAVLAGGAAVLVAVFLFSAQVFSSGLDRLVKSVVQCAAEVVAPDIYRFGGTLAAVGAIMLLWAFTLKRARKGG
ncbi:MAG: hypothetical protein NC192_00895 [Muribaculaceae bacterium]|nr:hypothetical protein [Muribaculaceae bacterium]